jgi:hypothetical protein
MQYFKFVSHNHLSVVIPKTDEEKLQALSRGYCETIALAKEAYKAELEERISTYQTEVARCQSAINDLACFN